jgi:hypothetical protein
MPDNPVTNWATGAAAADTTTNIAVGAATTKPIIGATTIKPTIGAAKTKPKSGAATTKHTTSPIIPVGATHAVVTNSVACTTIRGGRRRLPGCPLSSRASTWLVPRMVLWGGHCLALLRLAAKLSHVGADVDRLVLPPIAAYELWLGSRGTEPSDRRYPIPSHCIGRHGFRPPFWGCKTTGTGHLSWCWSPRSLMDRISYGEARLYQDGLIRCQSYHGDYACSCERDVMLDGDGMDSSTQVHYVRCMWASVAMSNHAKH